MLFLLRINYFSWIEAIGFWLCSDTWFQSTWWSPNYSMIVPCDICTLHNIHNGGSMPSISQWKPIQQMEMIIILFPGYSLCACLCNESILQIYSLFCHRVQFYCRFTLFFSFFTGMKRTLLHTIQIAYIWAKCCPKGTLVLKWLNVKAASAVCILSSSLKNSVWNVIRYFSFYLLLFLSLVLFRWFLVPPAVFSSFSLSRFRTHYPLHLSHSLSHNFLCYPYTRALLSYDV